MKNTLHFFLSAILLLATASPAFSRIPSIHPFKPNRSIHTTLLPLSGIPSTAALAKQSAAAKDSSVVSRVDMYEWEDTGWAGGGYVVFTYDNRGRIIEYLIRSANDDTTYGQATIEYVQLDNYLKQTTISVDSTSRYHVKTVVEMYGDNIRYGYYPMMGEIPFIPTMDYVTDFFWYDSMIINYFLLDTLTGAWEPYMFYRYSYSFNENTGTYFIKFWLDPDEEPFTYTYEIAMKMNADNLIDTLIYYFLDSNGTRLEYCKSTYSYNSNGQLISGIVTIREMDTGTVYEEGKIAITYNADGRVASCMMGSRDTLTGEWLNEMNLIYSYTTIPIAEIKRHPAPRTRPAVSATVRQGKVFVEPGDVDVREIALFDVQGRVVWRDHPIRKLRVGESITMPWGLIGRRVHLLQARTDRGIIRLKVNGAAISNR